MRFFTQTKVEEVVIGGIMISGKKKRVLKAETVVLACGSKSNSELAKALNGRVKELSTVSDSVEPRRSLEARDAYYE